MLHFSTHELDLGPGVKIWSCQIHLDSLNLNKAGATLSLSIKNGVGLTLTGVPSLHCNEEQKEIVELRILSCQIHLDSYFASYNVRHLEPNLCFLCLCCAFDFNCCFLFQPMQLLT